MSLNPVKPINTPQEITLAGFTYSMPSVISAGLRAKITDGQTLLYADPEKLKAMTRDERKSFDESFDREYPLWIMSHQYESKLFILNKMLTPRDEAPAVEEIFNLAPAEETDAVINFFNTGVYSKTNESESTPDASKEAIPSGQESEVATATS